MWRSQSIKEGKRKQYDQGRPSMMKGKQHRESRARKNSFFPCLERQESLVELDMVIILRIRTIGWSVHPNTTIAIYKIYRMQMFNVIENMYTG